MSFSSLCSSSCTIRVGMQCCSTVSPFLEHIFGQDNSASWNPSHRFVTNIPRTRLSDIFVFGESLNVRSGRILLFWTVALQSTTISPSASYCDHRSMSLDSDRIEPGPIVNTSGNSPQPRKERRVTICTVPEIIPDLESVQKRDLSEFRPADRSHGSESIDGPKRTTWVPKFLRGLLDQRGERRSKIKRSSHRKKEEEGNSSTVDTHASQKDIIVPGSGPSNPHCKERRETQTNLNGDESLAQTD